MNTSYTLAPRLLAGFGMLALLGAIGLVSSRPAHTAGGPIAVSIANTPLAVTASDVTAPQQPFAISVTPSPSENRSFTVPAGKRLVIQQISVVANTDTAQDIALLATTSGQFERTIVPFTAVKDGMQYANQSLTFYADPGTNVIVVVTDSNPKDNRGINVDIIGYLVDVK